MTSSTFLDLPDGRRIAYHLSEGALPCVIFLGGFKSDMTGSKALALEALCQRRGQRFIRFDYTGHGQSSGKFEDGTIGSWKQDAQDVLDRLGAKSNILIGSSMGAWLALLLTIGNAQKVSSVVGIASAPDFTERLIWQKLTPQQQQQMKKDGVFYAPSCYGEAPYPITMRLIEESRAHLLLDKAIPISRPVRLIHGTRDEDVPREIPLKLVECLESKDVTLEWVEGGGHRLSEPAQLKLICETAEQLM